MGLSFLTPMLLGGAALVAVPVILHLVMRRRPVPHDFPALRFLRERAVANRRRLRLNHLLLLLLRMAALTLLALALARPVLRGAGWIAEGEGPVASAFVFDTAPRMLLREGNRTRLEQASTMARTLLGKLPGGSRVAVVDTSGGAAAFAPNVAAAAARIERLAATPQVTTLPAAIAEARRLLAGAEFARRELYVFTDASHGAWDNAVPPAADRADGISELAIDVGAAAPQNFALEAIDISGDRVAAGTPLAITVAASRVGPDAGRNLAVEMLGTDGRYVRRAMKPVKWTATAPARVDFDVGGLEPGTRQGRVVLEGSDDLEADDVRYFTVEVGAAPRVIVAAQRPARTSAGLLVRALEGRFTVTAVDVEGLDTAGWEEPRGIVLVDPPPLPPQTWNALGDWVGGGRGLVIWLGPRAGSPEKFNTEASRRLLGGAVVRVWRSVDGNFVAPAALDHPILAAFRRVGDSVPWQDFPVLRHWEFAASAEDDAGGSAAAVVARYRNGLPAIVEHPVGAGRVVVVTTPVSRRADDPDAWNTLATGFEPWPFLILANTTLLAAIDTTDDRNVFTGMPAVLHLDRRDVPAVYVRSPAGDDFPAAVDQKQGTITFTATQLPGNYTVRAGGETAGVAKGFSVNLPPQATDFARLAPDALAAVLGPHVRIARTEDELVRDVNLERIGAELFPWMIVLAAIAMAADWIVANRFYAPRAGADPGQGAAATFAETVTAAEFAPPPPPVPPPAAGPPPLPAAAVPPPVPVEVRG